MIINPLDIKEQIFKAYGKDYSYYDQDFFTKCLESRKAKLGLNDTEAYLEFLVGSPEELDQLEIILNNHYSIFFRNPLLFYALEQYFLPQLILKKEQNGNQQIRIWSMACAYGQEAYSVAILLDEVLKKKSRSLDFCIFSTDINPACIHKAKSGLFSKEDLQHINLSRLDTYFETEGKLYRIKPPLKQKLIFSCYDLLDPLSNAPSESIYSEFDLILCCNVLYYYSAQHQKRIIDKIKKTLGKNGILITDESEKDLISNYSVWSSKTLVLPIFQNSPKESA